VPKRKGEKKKETKPQQGSVICNRQRIGPHPGENRQRLKEISKEKEPQQPEGEKEK